VVMAFLCATADHVRRFNTNRIVDAAVQAVHLAAWLVHDNAGMKFNTISLGMRARPEPDRMDPKAVPQPALGLDRMGKGRGSEAPWRFRAEP
jgi:hypothetical protein